MIQDARDQEQASTPQPENHDQTQKVDNEDLAAAFLRDTEIVEDAVEDGKKVRRRRESTYCPTCLLRPLCFQASLPLSPVLTVILRRLQSLFSLLWCWMGLDGRVARMTNTQSEFGAEYDSLADMISFGMAPALVAFTWILQDIGKQPAGWSRFSMTGCAALRLARFNVQNEVLIRNGLSAFLSPLAGSTSGGVCLHIPQFDADAFGFKLLMLVVVEDVGILDGQQYRYYSFKDLDFKSQYPL